VESLAKGEEICLRLDASIPSMENALKGSFRHSQVAGEDFTIHAHAASTQSHQLWNMESNTFCQL
jgi:hypothetical protein